ncbi:O-antigen ligase family protein [Endozoicomonas arenosclerae]|uniref:O-antigen ligase family protein n=1 Tax=Endozoicomonas arenosclerae TaxID=1633495 RepID=UPI0009A1EF7B|nr:O-antigen ligase family protein [Endozoicomonas arenosclerae]
MIASRIDNSLVRFILPLGLFFQISSIHWLGRGADVSQTYTWLLLPALICFLLNIKDLTSWRPDLQEMCIAGFLLLAMFSWWWSASEKPWIDVIKKCLYISMYLYAIVRLSQRGKLLEKTLIASVVIATLGAAAALINQYLIQDHSLNYRSYRIYSMGVARLGDLGNPIPAGIYFGAIATLLFSWSCTRLLKPWQLTLSIVGVCILLLYVLMTGSRGPQLATAVAFLIACLLIKNKRTKLFLTLGIITAVVGLYFFQETFFEINNDTTLNGRVPIWLSTLNQISENPWIGKGLDYKMSNFWQGTYYIYAHNYYLQSLLNYGILGFALFAGIIGSTLFLMKKYWQNTLAKVSFFLLIYGMTCMLTEISRLIIIPDEAWLIFWLPIGVILGVKYKSSSHPQYLTVKTTEYTVADKIEAATPSEKASSK